MPFQEVMLAEFPLVPLSQLQGLPFLWPGRVRWFRWVGASGWPRPGSSIAADVPWIFSERQGGALLGASRNS